MNNDHQKIIVSVGAGVTQLPLIQAIKDRGYKVAAFGKGRNDQEAIRLSDYFEEINTADHEGAIRWLSGLPGNIAAVGSYAGGVAIRTLQEISRHFQLPTSIPQELSVGMDKFEQQILYEKYKLSTIRTFRYEQLRQNPELIRGISRFIIKPAIGRGSAGVQEVNAHELRHILAQDSLEANDMIQELKSGVEYRMLVIAQDFELRLLAPIKRESFHESFLLGRLSYADDHLERIRAYVTELLRNLKLKDAILKADVIVSEDQVDMIELDIGVGGGIYFKQFISHLFQYDITTEYLNLITGQPVAAAGTVDGRLVMDYVFNLTGHPVKYDIESCLHILKARLGEDIKLIPNLLSPERSGRFASNADFIFCIVHSHKTLDNIELNRFVNQEIFEKCGED